MMEIPEIPVLIQSSESQANPVIIRGHTLLCLQGFRGEGYSPDFIDNMAVIHTRLQSHPETRVRVTDSPDLFCAACPNLKESEPLAMPGRARGVGASEDQQLVSPHGPPHQKIGCTLRGPDFEQHIVSQDRQVLDLLGLRVGQEVTWAEVLQRIGSRARGEMLDGICGDCQWLSLGYCQEGIERLRAATDSSLIT
ncbi:MAG: DUF1284 domain-containing protein [Nitrospira sp.]|nr:DUF1284 domain-containing protein [Nitrospira sp.]